MSAIAARETRKRRSDSPRASAPNRLNGVSSTRTLRPAMRGAMPALLTATSRRPKRDSMLLEHARDGPLVGNVSRDPDRVGAAVAQLARGLLDRFGPLAVHDDPEAIGGERLRERESDALVGAGDQGDSMVFSQRGPPRMRLAVQLNGR